MGSRLHILQHSLGLNKRSEGRQYRNHFIASPGTCDFYDCCVMVEQGLMECRRPNELSGGSHCFVVTSAGIEFVASEVRHGA